MPKQLLNILKKQKLAQKKGPEHGGIPVPEISVAPADKANARRSGGGHSGGGALSNRIDFPYVGSGRLPIKTRGAPSMSFDVNASEIMQNMIMNDDDKEWYKELFKKQNKYFLEPRFSVSNGMDIGLSCGIEYAGSTITETDHRVSSFGFFIPVPHEMARKIEKIYPRAAERSNKDDSPLHITVLYVGDIDEQQVMLAREAAKVALSEMEPFAVYVDGTDHFYNDDSAVFHIRVGSKELSNIHHSLKGALESAGVPVQHSYGAAGDRIFKGHITLAYLPPGEQEKDIAFRGSWTVDRVEMWNMGSPVSMKLGQKSCCSCCAQGLPCSGVNESMLQTAGHVTLDLIGLIPGVGEIADVTNAVLYAKKEDYLMAALSLISAIPAIGDFVGKGGKLLTTIGKAGPHIKKIKLFIDVNRPLIDQVFSAAQENEKLARYVPRMREALEALGTKESILKDFINMIVESNDDDEKNRKSPRAEKGKDLLMEPDDLDKKSEEEEKDKKQEFNAVGSGAVSGYTGPLKGTGKKDKRDAKAFGGGSFASPNRKRPKWAGPGKSLV